MSPSFFFRLTCKILIQTNRQREIASAQMAQITPNSASIAKVEVDVSKCTWDRAIVSTFEERRLSVLSPAKPGKSTRELATALFGGKKRNNSVMNKKTGGGAKMAVFTLSSGEEGEEEEDLSLAARMVRQLFQMSVRTWLLALIFCPVPLFYVPRPAPNSANVQSSPTEAKD